ncbi:MAG: hypothetical protein CUN56_04020 [Phototrophicales bacterium]|nr:MAG: hypothetical protein CUN56_04020 [Phototrophicales bacterium]RMG71180.1 MAG: prenyltransferase [Chloroflexota bacterium]
MTHSTNTTILRQTQHIITGIIHLSRWKEHLPLTVLTLLGGLIASSVHPDVKMDWRLLAITAANFLTVTFAFMINDIEDAADDAANPVSARRNPVTNGTIDVYTAWIACGFVVAAAIGLFTLGGTIVLGIGAFNLLLSFLYSWKPIRFKSSSFGLDIISHTLMLGGLLPLAGYFIYSNEAHPAIILMAAAATLGSTYGQLYNQVRDYEADKKAGIVNVAIRLGERPTWILAYSAIALTIILGLAALLQMTFPTWLILISLGSIVIGFTGAYLFNGKDASGKDALDLTGRLQPGVWFALIVTVLAWVVWVMF